MVTGQVNHEYALESRNNENKCGEKGQYFKSLL
jgi:hypothetical protein